MLTTIKENVIVDKNGMIKLNVNTFKANSKLSVIAVIEFDKYSVINKSDSNSTSLYGILNNYANKDLIELENNAFSTAMEDKHASIMCL